MTSSTTDRALIDSPTILTAAGKYFSLLDPASTPVQIGEIAHALSHICRFTGHTKTFYSVAEHCVHVSYLVPPEHALLGLMHDAAEAFLGDVSSPLKSLLPDYKVLERHVHAAVMQRFGLPAEMPAAVKHADLVMLATEQRDLMPGAGEVWRCLEGIQPRRQPLQPMSSSLAALAFLARWYELGGRDRDAL